MTDDQAVQLLQAIRAHSGLELSAIRAAGDHGADGGWGGFTYYDDTSEFYASAKSLIWSILEEDASEYGFDNVPAFVASFARADLADDEVGFECLLAWYALESAGRWLTDRRESRVHA